MPPNHDPEQFWYWHLFIPVEWEGVRTFYWRAELPGFCRVAKTTHSLAARAAAEQKFLPYLLDMYIQEAYAVRFDFSADTSQLSRGMWLERIESMNPESRMRIVVSELLAEHVSVGP
jgi:hypothetical protein